MRFRRCIFLVKCFAVGCVLRFLLFGLVVIQRRLFVQNSISERKVQTVDRMDKKSQSYAAADFGERKEGGSKQTAMKNLVHHVNWSSDCSMSRCFNFSRCYGKPFKVHIYPSSDLELLLKSAADSSSASAYAKILSSIIRSGYYTSDPSQACLFVVAFDTLDRDLLSGDYLKNLHSKFSSLPHSLWNNGENHLIFNLYQGTWPNYDVTDLGISTGKAMLVKASFSIRHFRPNFDISLPLFHRVLPLTTVDEDDQLFRPLVSSGVYGSDAHRRRYLFSFKGKRYVHGIGSETRNSLYHLHDGGRESVVVTTCRHGKNWHQVKDERCDEDNESYDRYGTYEQLLSQSDFCLVPRGRRLGSYRFLESLQYGCIPTILANEWELPFSEIVTWSEAAVMADERLLSLVPDNLQGIEPSKTFAMRQKAKALSRMFFSSVDRIVTTTLEIVKRRLQPWTESSLDKERFEAPARPVVPVPLFHAYVVVAKESPGAPKRMLDVLSSSSFCTEITVLCFDCTIAKIDASCPTTIVRLNAGDAVPIFADDTAKQSDAIFWIDASVSLNQLSVDEVDFAMRVWQWFPDRLVGFFSRRHQSDGRLSSKLLNDYTFLTGDAILYHKSYNDDLNAKLSSISYQLRLPCFDRLLNQLAAAKGYRPIKLTARYRSGRSALDSVSDADCFGPAWNATLELNAKSSRVRFDPMLYKDSVSNLRKKYRQMEAPAG